MKKLWIALFICFALITAGTVFGSSYLQVDDSSLHRPIQVFAPTAVVAISGNGSMAVSDYKVVMFNVDVTIQINGSGSTYDWPADTPLGIAHNVTTLTLSGLSGATTALVM